MQEGEKVAVMHHRRVQFVATPVLPHQSSPEKLILVFLQMKTQGTMSSDQTNSH